MDISQTSIELIPMEEIHDDKEFNCRGHIAPIDVVDLAKDIAENGLIQPVTVMEYSDEDKQRTGKKYLLIAGYRRYLSFQINKQPAIPAIVRNDITDEAHAKLLNLSENLKRKDLDILQEAKAIERLKELGFTEAMTAEKLGMSRGWVQIRFMVLKLPEVVQQEIAAGFLSQTQIRQAYTNFRRGGKEACFESVRKMKDARLKGEKTVRIGREKDAQKERESKRNRKRNEIFELMDHIRPAIGNGLHTRCLAWCAGEISTQELYSSIKAYADANGISYTIPTAV